MTCINENSVPLTIERRWTSIQGSDASSVDLLSVPIMHFRTAPILWYCSPRGSHKETLRAFPLPWILSGAFLSASGLFLLFHGLWMYSGTGTLRVICSPTTWNWTCFLRVSCQSGQGSSAPPGRRMLNCNTHLTSSPSCSSINIQHVLHNQI